MTFTTPYSDGYISREWDKKNQLWDKDTAFLVVFQLGQNVCYITNMENVNCSIIEPFHKEWYDSTDKSCKVAYFSNMFRADSDVLFKDERGIRVYGAPVGSMEEKIEMLKRTMYIDYSEASSFIIRTVSMKNGINVIESGKVNQELCYQLTFLKNMEIEKICEYLDMEQDKKFYITSHQNEVTEEITLQNLRENIEEIEKRFLVLLDAKINYFSSGEYAKFSFLSKLYWFLEGYMKEEKRYSDNARNSTFSASQALLPKETAVIFIDEGETYYHPEWQRRYIKTLLEMINAKEEKTKIQIIITTNSPFILSDILKEDVIYLPDKKGNAESKAFDATLGQNIHKLLVENCFMEYTIGAYAYDVIQKIMKCLESISARQDGKQQENEEYEKINVRDELNYFFEDDIECYDALKRLINQIGEPIYRNNLKERLENLPVQNKEKEIDRLEKECKKMQERIAALRAEKKEGN